MGDVPADVADFISASTRDYVLKLLREPSLVNALLEPRLQQLIAAGDIVPRSRLQLGVGLELAPLGLEQAARALIAAAAGIEMPEMQGFTEAVAALTAVLERVEAPTLPVTPSASADELPADDEPVDEVEEFRCKVCDEPVDREQALASKTRHREVLCKKDHATYDPKKRRKAS